MPAATLALGAALDVASLVLYFLGGRRILREFGDDPARSRESFALFWYAVGAVNGLQALLAGLAIVRDPGVALATSVWTARIALALLGFAGLSYYLLHVYTGRRGIAYGIAAYHLGAFILLMTFIFAARPIDANVTGWRVDLVMANAHPPTYGLAVIAFFLSPLVGALAYAALLRRDLAPGQRWRVRLTSAGLALWLLGLIAGYLTTWPLWGLVENLLGIGSAAAVLVALHPPPHVGPPPPRDATAAAVRALSPAFQRRLRELV